LGWDWPHPLIVVIVVVAVSQRFQTSAAREVKVLQPEVSFLDAVLSVGCWEGKADWGMGMERPPVIPHFSQATTTRQLTTTKMSQPERHLLGVPARRGRGSRSENEKRFCSRAKTTAQLILVMEPFVAEEATVPNRGLVSGLSALYKMTLPPSLSWAW
jgi:hypothetical protein